MTLRDLISDFPAGPGEPRANLLYARLLFVYLSDHVYSAELKNGVKLRDVTDFHVWLRELAEEVRAIAKIAPGTEVSLRQELSTRPKLAAPAPQRRWDEFCPECGHIHIDDAECGFPQGGGRVCRCERAVRA